MRAFAIRCAKEILRDPLSFAFGLGFPLAVLLLLSAIQANVPVPLFEISKLAPGIAVFGLSFVSLFTAQLVSKDRCGAFVMRLFASPLRAKDFILGYCLPMLPMALLQGAVCFGTALILGLQPTLGILWSLISLIPSMLLFIGIGLLCGSLLSDRQVGGIVGALLTNVTAWLSGTWFDLNLVGGGFKRVADLLPFSHAVEAGRAALAGDLAACIPHALWVAGYAVAALSLATWAFRRQMRG